MAGTRPKNKTAHPAAPVMTNTAKIKAGIPTAKRQTKKISKADQIRELEARLATFEHPDDGNFISKEPLVSQSAPPLVRTTCAPADPHFLQFLRDSSPEDVERLVVGSEAPTEADAEDYVVVGGKRIPLNDYDPQYIWRVFFGHALILFPRGLKRTKTYSSFNKIRPTTCNKLSGLVNNWHQVVTKEQLSRSSTPTLSTSSSSQVLTPSPSSQVFMPSLSSQVFTPSPSSQVLSPSLSASWQQETYPAMSNTNLFSPMMPTPDSLTSYLNQQSFSYQFNAAVDNALQVFQGVPTTPPVHPVVYSFPRRYKDEASKTQVPGLKDLPPNIHPNFRNTFIRHMMKITFSGMLPWSNPTVPVYQQEFNAVYPNLPYHLHGDDAVILSASIYTMVS
jgi:hypothetical protein